MHSLRTFLVEDEPPALRQLESLVQAHPRLEWVGSASSGHQALKQIPSLSPDLLILDINLKDQDSFEVLDQLGSSLSCKILFITAYAKYAARAFRVQAIDYLLKPYDEQRFQEAIDRVMQQQGLEQAKQALDTLTSSLIPQPIIIAEGSHQHFFSHEEILYIQAESYYATFFLNDASKKMLRVSLKELESILPPHFFRINRSIIINKFHLKEITRNSLLIRGQRFPISAAKQRAFKAWLVQS